MQKYAFTHKDGRKAIVLADSSRWALDVLGWNLDDLDPDVSISVGATPAFIIERIEVGAPVWIAEEKLEAGDAVVLIPQSNRVRKWRDEEALDPPGPPPDSF
jgi:hypothetical protein